MLQILFRAKDLDPEPRSQVVRGNHTQSALLAGLRKFAVYELQVLAFTRIGNGVPSLPLVLERTKDDGRCPPASAPTPRVGVAQRAMWAAVICNLISKPLFFQLRKTEQNCLSLSVYMTNFSRE